MLKKRPACVLQAGRSLYILQVYLFIAGIIGRRVFIFFAFGKCQPITHAW